MMGTLFESVNSLLGKTSLALDDEDFQAFLANCTSSFSYSVVTYSRELGKEMLWLDHDREGFESMVRMLPQHVRLQGSFSRHLTLSSVSPAEDDAVDVVSRLLVVYTSETGSSRTFACGRYLDTMQFSGDGGLALARRKVLLETRDLGPGVHVPL